MFSSIWILCPLKKNKLSISLLLGEFLIYFKYWLLIIFVFCTVPSYSKDGLLNKELLLLLWKSFFFWRNAICLFLLLLTAFEFLSLRTIEKAYSSLLSVFYQFQILYLIVNPSLGCSSAGEPLPSICEALCSRSYTYFKIKCIIISTWIFMYRVRGGFSFFCMWISNLLNISYWKCCFSAVCFWQLCKRLVGHK